LERRGLVRIEVGNVDQRERVAYLTAAGEAAIEAALSYWRKLRPARPTVIGNEGVGRVLAAGPGVENVKVGDRPGATFQLHLEGADGHIGRRPFRPAPGADPQQLALLAINTAALLLSE
jgi:NADPH:quinone reductase-like Zn-dependent oxidoreductase